MAISYRVSIKDIAKAAGVSFSTVSRALNDSPLISQAVRDHVQEIAKSMGYTPNALAQSLHSQQTNSVGLVITTIADPFFADIVHGVEERAKKAGISVFLATSNNDPEEEIRIIETFGRRRVDGVIVASSRIGPDYANRLGQIRIPVILVNAEANEEQNNLFSVSVNDFLGGCQAVQYLIDMGHRKIGYLGVSNRPASNKGRLDGYLATLKKNNIEVRPEWICKNDDLSPGALSLDISIGKDLAAQIFQTDVTAIFCYCDTIAAGVFEACRKSGISIPDDISIIGFDDNTISEIMQPTLTTIHQPKQEIGEIAMNMLLDCLSGGNVENVLLDPYLVVRESVAPPKTIS
jgi:LacI family transcriptional regulator/LacI family repressor for deo operon, udp, cdd, tsx, nupC, and nupG